MRLVRLSLCLACLGLAPPLRADEAKDQAKTYQVPYRLTETKHVLVRAKINGKGPFNFILDTGAPALFVTTAVGKKVGLEPGSGGWATCDRFEIEGGVVVPKAKARVEDLFQLEGMNGLGLAGAELHGVIGYTVLARFRTEYDFTKDKLTWTRLHFEPPAPMGLGDKGGAPPELAALGGVMKMLGGMLGKRPEPEIVPRGFLGVELERKGDRVLVASVLPGTPAAAAGLQAGDQISQFAGADVRDVPALRKLAGKLAAGQRAELKVRRGDEVKSVQVKLGKGF